MKNNKKDLTEESSQHEKDIAVKYITQLSVNISEVGKAIRRKIEIPIWISLISIIVISYITNVSLNLSYWLTTTISIIMILILAVHFIQLRVFSALISLPDRVGELKHSSVNIYKKIKKSTESRSTSDNSKSVSKLINKLSILRDIWSIRDEFQEIVLFLGIAALVINPLFLIILITSASFSIILIFISILFGIVAIFI